MDIKDFDIDGLLIKDDLSTEHKVTHLNLIRDTLPAEERTKVDTVLVNRICMLNDSINKLENINKRARKLIDKLTSDPFYPAYYLSAVETHVGVLLRIRANNDEYCVHFSDDLDLEQLEPGDEVLLNSNRNMVMAKSQYTNTTGDLANVDRILDAERVVIQNRGERTVVQLPSNIDCKKGDVVRWNKNAKFIMEKLNAEPPVASNVRQKLDIEKIRGIDLVSMVDKISNAILSEDLAKKYHIDGFNNKILLYGSPGTGKTTLAQGLADKLEEKIGKRVHFKAINGEELSSAYVGQTSANIRAVFAECNEFVEIHNSYCVLFIDEIDIYRRRGITNNHFHDRHTNTVLTEITGLHENVILVAATNQVDALDSALRDRFSIEIEFTRPNRKTAAEIFDVHLGDDLPFYTNGCTQSESKEKIIEQAVSSMYSPNADNELAVIKYRNGKTRVVKAPELVSGRLISQISANVKQNAFHRHLAGGRQGITGNDTLKAVETALDRLKRTLTIRNIHDYLSDLPQDMDVVSVEPVEKKVRHAHYLQ